MRAEINHRGTETQSFDANGRELTPILQERTKKTKAGLTADVTDKHGFRTGGYGGNRGDGEMKHTQGLMRAQVGVP